MENLSTELGPEALALVAIIGVLVQQCKRVPRIVAMKEQVPIFVIIAIGLGITAAYQQSIPNPIVAGVMMGLMAAGAYSTTKNGKGKK
jgi:hypothetical protein